MEKGASYRVPYLVKATSGIEKILLSPYFTRL
jgi:hypothetical protein